MLYFLSSGIRTLPFHRLLPLLATMAAACGGLSEPHPLYEGAKDEPNGAAGTGGNGDDDVVGRSRDGNLNVDAGITATPNNRPDGSAAGDGGGGLTPLIGTAQACGMVADALCARAVACAPFNLAQNFGSAEVCKKRLQAACVADANATNSGATNGGLIRCSQALNESACGDLADGKRPSACRFVGTRSSGQPCGTHMQCQTGFCDGAADDGAAAKGCGQCAVPGAKDSTCTTDDECSAPLGCNLEGKCVKRAQIGGACKPGYQPCDANLVCIDQKCKPPLEAGSPCVHSDQCGISLGLVCTPDKVDSDTLSCRSVAPVAPGNRCGDNGMVTQPCIGGSTQCQPVGPEESLICVAPIRDGEACAPGEGKHCAAPSRCIAGFCRLGSPPGC
jgi:hypothetical protein